MFNIKFEANMLHYDLGQQLIGEINYCQEKIFLIKGLVTSF